MDLILLFSLLLPLTISPGPVNIALAGYGARNGILKTAPFFAGLLTSAALVILLCAVGVHGMISEEAVLGEVIRYAGIAYIFYLALGFLRGGTSDSGKKGKSGRFHDGFMLTLLNPKFYAMVVAVFGQFAIDRAGFLPVSLIFLATLAASQGVWLVFGAALKRLAANHIYDRMLGVVFGTMLALTGFLLLL